MPKYAILIHDDQSNYINATPEMWAAVVEAHGAFREKVFELGGSLAGGEALAPAITTITNGTTVTEGPMRSLMCTTLFRMFGHRICCGPIPNWTAGRHWQTVDLAPWNMYNILWRAQHWIRGGVH